MRITVWLQGKASTIIYAASAELGRDYPAGVPRKKRETPLKIEALLDRNDAGERVEEAGDLLLALVNLTRHIGT
jgi:hypothetical protein